MLILCHKDGGVLHHDEPSEVVGLYYCGCISGYVRGFEPSLTRLDAIKAQVAETKEWIKTFTSQGRDDSYLRPLRERLAKLESLS